MLQHTTISVSDLSKSFICLLNERPPVCTDNREINTDTHRKMDETWKAKVGWHGYFR